MLLGRFIPIIAPLALAGSLAAKKRTPFTAGTLRTDTLTFGFVLLGTILLVGAAVHAGGGARPGRRTSGTDAVWTMRAGVAPRHAGVASPPRSERGSRDDSRSRESI